MCIIVDNNVIARVLLSDEDVDFRELQRALVFGEGPDVKLFYGGKLRREYAKNDKVRRLVAVLDAAGRAHVVPDSDVDDEQARLEKLGICSSDDEHVIALARVSGVRVLCSHDHALQTDFRDKRLIDKPRGKIYLRQSHRNLLRRPCR